MNPLQLAIALPVMLFAGLLACLEIGYRLGRRSSQSHPELTHEGIGVIDAAVFALLGLLLGFSFAGGTSRLEARRQLIVQEANGIGTAYLRLDLLPPGDQPVMRHLFREYLDTRLRAYDKLPDLRAVDQELGRAAEMQQEIWLRAVTSSRTDSTQSASRLLLPALNEMIDVTTGRTLAIHSHLPSLIFFLLVFVALLSALLAGYAMEKRKKRSPLHMFLYAAVIAVTLYAILDLDYPRSGLIRLDTADRLLLQLRDSFR
jgi:phosphotransferase system  glucose/maltose/N-acetylglucosamine-specific IIC component